ncbi:MAG TPA: type II CAAX endopeptidase family protein [Candidatus Elarobacter sp.]|nr:type II CAAX endopeptidase family protein [Candidatus Elarobacter sp.]
MIGAIVSFAGALVLVIALVVATGRAPSSAPGHPFVAAMETAFYLAGGAFALYRLRTTGRRPFRKLSAHDVRTILLGIAALAVVRLATIVQLVLTHQTKHVQSGFEHFDVVTKQPALTAVAIVLTVAAMVALGPIAEETIFRGLLLGALAPRTGVLVGAVITAVIFGAAHTDLVLFPTLAALGFVNALAYAATGNLWVPITLHALNNALGAAFLIATSLHHH